MGFAFFFFSFFFELLKENAISFTLAERERENWVGSKVRLCLEKCSFGAVSDFWLLLRFVDKDKLVLRIRDIEGKS